MIKKVYCPLLKKNVNFNVKGLKHIKFKLWNRTRLISDQYLRLKFLHLVPKVVEKSCTLQEFNKTKSYERRKRNSSWEKQLVIVRYYGFVAIIKYRIKIKVIVKEVSGGQPYFWSVIPFWKNKKDPITNETKKVFHEGDLEND